jgi:hypothetical protein
VTSKAVRSGSRSAGVKVKSVALQLNAPMTGGLIANAACAPACSTGSEKATSMLVVVSAWWGSPLKCWVSETSTTVGPRASTVEA